MQAFLQSSEYIDVEHPSIAKKAHELAYHLSSKTNIAQACFEYVRDQIKHSNDYQLNPVTCKASEVLEHKTGYCYAKSHLLAALLRANQIPAALCYQRLSINDVSEPFCLHGLNAIYLEPHGWYRVDARGNKTGVNAQFTPPVEQLAYPIKIAGEQDIEELYSEPLQEVIDVLTRYETYLQVAENLPDLEIEK